MRFVLSTWLRGSGSRHSFRGLPEGVLGIQGLRHVPGKSWHRKIPESSLFIIHYTVSVYGKLFSLNFSLQISAVCTSALLQDMVAISS